MNVISRSESECLESVSESGNRDMVKKVSKVYKNVCVLECMIVLAYSVWEGFKGQVLVPLAFMNARKLLLSLIYGNTKPRL